MIIYKKIRPNPFLISGKTFKTGQSHAAFVLTVIQGPISLMTDDLSGKTRALRYNLWKRLTEARRSEHPMTVFCQSQLKQ